MYSSRLYRTTEGAQLGSTPGIASMNHIFEEIGNFHIWRSLITCTFSAVITRRGVFFLVGEAA
jgi:hypothetical protein